MRLQMESRYWNDMCFVTLTYNDENLPINIIDPHLFFTDEEIADHPEYNFLHVPTHRHSDLTLFIKRLRKHLEHKCKYYAVGEYGTRYGRSHLHILFFGLSAVDSTRRLIEKCWPYGFVDVEYAFPETCYYVAGYVQKKLYGNDRDFFKLPEFMRCSQHLGERWLYDHINQFDDDHPFINLNGYRYGLPRQFRKILVKEGRLHEVSLQACVLQQKKEYEDLSDHLSATGTSVSEFFRGRINNAIEKAKHRNRKRDITGDI